MEPPWLLFSNWSILYFFSTFWRDFIFVFSKSTTGARHVTFKLPPPRRQAIGFIILHDLHRVAGEGRSGEEAAEVLLEAEGGGTGGGEVTPTLHHHPRAVSQLVTKKNIDELLESKVDSILLRGGGGGNFNFPSLYASEYLNMTIVLLSIYLI